MISDVGLSVALCNKDSPHPPNLLKFDRNKMLKKEIITF